MRNVIYTICYYRDKDEQRFYEEFILKYYKLYFKEHTKDFDFKIIDYISEDVESTFTNIKKYWENSPDKKLFVNAENDAYDLGRNYLHKIQDQDKSHPLKMWMMKIKVIEDFYNSQYENMFYIDADILLDWSSKFDFETILKNNILFYMHTTTRPGKPHLVNNHYLNKNISKRVINCFILLSKKFPYNLQKLWNLNDQEKLCKSNPAYLHDEIFLTHAFYQNIYNKSIFDFIDKNIPGFVYTHMGAPRIKKLWLQLHQKNGLYLLEILNYYNKMPEGIKQRLFKTRRSIEKC